MHDDFLSKDWAESHQSLSADIDKLARHFWSGFARLQARQFDAPWRAPRTRADRCAC